MIDWSYIVWLSGLSKSSNLTLLHFPLQFDIISSIVSLAKAEKNHLHVSELDEACVVDQRGNFVSEVFYIVQPNPDIQKNQNVSVRFPSWYSFFVSHVASFPRHNILFFVLFIVILIYSYSFYIVVWVKEFHPTLLQSPFISLVINFYFLII